MALDPNDLHVLVGAPTYDGKRYNSLSLVRLFRNPPTLVNLTEMGGSVLTYGFNSLWCGALNLRTGPKPVTHFLLWHADIVPLTEDWLSVMLSEMDRVGAKVLSAVVPIKNAQGMTSTARDTNKWNPLRYSTTEINRLKEPTWTEPDLLINTGLLLVDFREDWVEKIVFTMEDTIIKDDKGMWRAYFVPEDWSFSRQCRELGVPVWATKAVPVRHLGVMGYDSNTTWGHPTDAAYRAAQAKANEETS